jgi:hypothetical protein
MLFWIVDNQLWVLVLLALVGLGFGWMWWLTRDKRWLIGDGVAAALAAGVVVLALFVVTDRMQLERNVDAIRDAVNAGKFDEALKHFEDQVEVETATKKEKVPKVLMAEVARRNKDKYGVQHVFTSAFDVDEISRPNAAVRFVIITDNEQRGWCKMRFRLSPEGQWRVTGFTVESYIGGQVAPVLVFP